MNLLEKFRETALSVLPVRGLVLALGRVFRKKLGCMPQHGMYDEMGAYSFLLYTKATAFVKSAFRNTKSTLFEVQVLLP